MDRSLYRSANNFANRTQWLHGPMTAYAKYGIVVFGILILVGWWQARSAADPSVAVAAVAWAGAAPLVALGLAQILNHLVDRARPYAAIPTAHVLVSRTTDASFPSDHAVAAGAVAAALVLAGAVLGDRRLGIVATTAAVVMAFVRLYVGAHYLTDVLAGLALGAVTAVALAPIARRILVSVATWAAGTSLRWFVTAHPTGVSARS